MGISYGPKMVTDGLILSLDSGDLNSYPGFDNTWYDLSGNGYHHTLINSPTYTNDQKFYLDGTNGFYYGSSIPRTENCTVVIFYKTTDTQELWVTVQYNGSYYLSASSGNNYYHSNVGSPTNYVDLGVVTNPYTEGFKDDKFHMWEAKNVNFSGWPEFAWFTYGGGWQLIGTVAKIMVYNRTLTADESRQNYNAMKTRFQ